MAKRTGFLRSGAAGPSPEAMYGGGVGTLSQAQTSVFAPPGTFPRFGIDFSQPNTWAWIYFALAVGYIFGVYALHGGRRGGII